MIILLQNAYLLLHSSYIYYFIVGIHFVYKTYIR